MKAIAINASPRKGKNTAELLEAALKGAGEAGAETSLINLIDLKFSGCVSCFGCKKLGENGETTKFCFVRDDLGPVLASCMEADAVFVGSPIYVSDVTGLFRNFFERLTFMNISYGNFPDPFKGKISFGLFYTTNAPQEAVEKMYWPMFEGHKGMLERIFHGKAALYAATDTLQFDDYSKYDSGNFSEEKKRKRRKEQFPKDLEEARKIGFSLIAR
ncbi:MAG: flavodoxin family protein [Eubacteriaceae bacterium]|jgi:multimeric flavodoxin WrbA|nr:flavodoxin family protein [Eubacteriaceae bacterium]